MSPHNDDDSSKRLHVLSANEIAALYDLPKFTAEEQAHFFSLSADARALLPKWHTFASRMFFILQLGYFKAVQQFFVFKLAEVIEDVIWIRQNHLPDRELPTSTVAKGTRPKIPKYCLKLNLPYFCQFLGPRATPQKHPFPERNTG